MKYSIITFGCQMNEADSRLMAAVLDQAGWEEVGAPEAADLVIVNTCSVREKPEHKVYSLLGELRELRPLKPGAVLAVVGCMAQREGKRVLRRAPNVDVVLGTRCFHHIVEVVRRVQAGERPLILTDLADDPAAIRCGVEAATAPLTAFVPIILGCTNFCSYCIVPYVRGKETSRPPGEVVEEVRGLVRGGTKEVTLLGQNVLAYGKDLGRAEVKRQKSKVKEDDNGLGGRAFFGLLRELNGIEGLERIRFTTCHPRDVGEGLIRALVELPKVCEHLHLPIQAGTEELLLEMRRGYTVAEYVATVARLREAVPDLGLTTDIMVGFPGETEEDFAESLRVYEQLRFDAAFTFAYSIRPGTVAAERSDQVPRKVKIERLERLIAVQNRITLEKNAAEVGRVAEVLVTGPAERGEGLLQGKTRQHKQVVFPGGLSLTGRVVRVRLVESHLWGFGGEVVG